MSTSPRMKWPYPREGEDPWYDSFEDLIRAQDASVFAFHDQKNIILSGGGTISWDASTGFVSWDAPIVLNSSQSGFIESIPPDSLYVGTDGQLGYVLFVTSPQNNVQLILRAVDSLPPADVDGAYILFRRRQNKLYWRNGGVLNDGDSAAIIDDGPGGGGGAVNAVTASAPLASSGGANPDISLVGVVDVANGGTGLAVIGAGSVLLGDGTNPITEVSPGAPGNVLTSTGASWVSAPAAGGGGSTVPLDTTGLVVGDAAYISADNTGSPTDATVSATARAAGLVHTIGGPGVGQVQVLGIFNEANFVAGLALAAGNPVYLSKTSGKLTNDVSAFVPGDVVAEIGLVMRVINAGGGDGAADVLLQMKVITVL